MSFFFKKKEYISEKKSLLGDEFAFNFSEIAPIRYK